MLLILIGGIYVIEALSVIIQTVSFKYWGRRVFLIAPIHHHFEMKAWSETKIMVRFWIVGRDPLRLRLRPLLPLLPPLQSCDEAGARARARALRAGGEGGARVAAATEVVAADRTLGNDTDLGLLDGVDVLVKSPGVPGEAPLVAAARERGIPVWSEIELAARLLPNPLVGVTGTNGKTTTTELLGAMLRRSGRPATSARALERARRGARAASLGRLRALELPARGRRGAPAADRRAAQPRAGPPRPARHLRGATATPSCGSSRTRPRRTSRSCRAASARFPGAARRIEFSADDELPAEPLIPGAHNRENAAAATAAARAAGIGDEAIAAALTSFAGVPHRLELVAEIDGVRYVNDSKATNTAAARRALTAFDAPLHLILGGSLKGERFDEFAQDVARANVAVAYLIGEAAEPLAVDLGYANVPFFLATTLERAVAEAASTAQPGEIVLLSPACASYDQFRDFEHRGEEFRRLVENLQG